MAETSPVLAEVRRLEPRPQAQPPALTKEQAQVAIVAASGLVAGAVVARVVGKRRKRKKRGQGILEVVSSKSFLVDVHLVDRK